MKFTQKGSGNNTCAIILALFVAGAYIGYDLYQQRTANNNQPSVGVITPSSLVSKNYQQKRYHKLLHRNQTLIDTNKTEPKMVPTPTTSAGPTTISSCGEITKGGRYILTRDITSGSEKPCLVVKNTKDVHIDCNGHSVTGNAAVSFENVKDFSLSHCKLEVINTAAVTALFIINSSNGDIFDNSIFTANAAESTTLRIKRNIFKGFYEQRYVKNGLIENNDFSLPNTRTASGVVSSSYGLKNKILNNKINGGAKGFFEDKKGADDGIILSVESFDLVQGNEVKNNWDCGIETLGFISNTQIIGNTITNSGVCGIGGWRGSSWVSNTVSDNMIDDAPYLFYFTRYHNLLTEQDLLKRFPPEKQIYFKDNNFTNNKFINPHQAKGTFSTVYSSWFVITPPFDEIFPDERVPESKDIITTNNRFTGNDFNKTIYAPAFTPKSMVIDGGGNICGSTEDGAGKIPPDYPLKCGQ